jgi:hypothetical protein
MFLLPPTKRSKKDQHTTRSRKQKNDRKTTHEPTTKRSATYKKAHTNISTQYQKIDAKNSLKNGPKND